MRGKHLKRTKKHFIFGILIVVGMVVALLGATSGQKEVTTTRTNEFHTEPLNFISPEPIYRVTHEKAIFYNTSVSETAVTTEVAEEEPPYTEDDLDLLSRLMTAEMGGSWVPDEVQLYVGSVVLNRMTSDLFPGETVYDVVYQPGQYSPTWSGAINNTPDERTIENAKRLLTDGSILPENVVFQASFKQGDGVYHAYYDEVLGTTTYFCFAGTN